MSYEKGYMYAIDRSDEYLEHYGIKGMRWGVRKALESGNSRALARQYRKASRKLARLEKRATSGKKYARRAALLGAGAAAGGMAALGTSGAAHLMTSNTTRNAIKGVGGAVEGIGRVLPGSVGTRVRQAGHRMRNEAARMAKGRDNSAVLNAAGRLQDWGERPGFTLANAHSARLQKHADEARRIATEKFSGTYAGQSRRKAAELVERANRYQDKATAARTPVSNNAIVRAGAAAVGAGLLGAAGYNAYRAATTKKAAAKAAQWKKEMNSAFKGTQYANGGSAKPSTKKRRRR